MSKGAYLGDRLMILKYFACNLLISNGLLKMLQAFLFIFIFFCPLPRVHLWLIVGETTSMSVQLPMYYSCFGMCSNS